MKAIILSAGKGERLRPLTNDLPKVMLPIANKPILQYHIEQLKKVGITNIAINLHHSPEKIKSYFGDGAKLGIHLTYSYEPELLGTSGAVKKLNEFFNETFIVVYGDIVSEFNLKELIEFHKQKKGKVTITVHKSDHPWDSGCVLIDDNNKVIKFQGKPG